MPSHFVCVGPVLLDDADAGQSVSASQADIPAGMSKGRRIRPAECQHQAVFAVWFQSLHFRAACFYSHCKATEPSVLFTSLRVASTGAC